MIALLSMIALPRLLMAQQSAGAASAIGSLRAINSGQLVYALTCAAGFYAPRLTVLGQPPPGSRDPFISYNLGYSDTVTRSNYIIQMSGASYAGAPGACNGMAAGDGAQSFKSAADPAQPGNVRFFGSNANGQIWEHSSTHVRRDAGDRHTRHRRATQVGRLRNLQFTIVNCKFRTL